MTPDQLEEKQQELLKELPSHLMLLYTKSANKLTLRQNIQVVKVLIAYEYRFSKGPLDLRLIKDIHHAIPTTDEQPIKMKLRRTPLGFEKEEEKTLNSMLAAKVIAESTSDSCSAPVLVRKKDGDIRYCI